MESIILDNLMEYFFVNNLLFVNSMVLLKGDIQFCKLLKVLDDWFHLLEGQTYVIYTDLEKDFDKVSTNAY